MIAEFKPGDKFIKNQRAIQYVHNIRSTSEKWMQRRSVTFNIELLEVYDFEDCIRYMTKIAICENGLFVFYCYDEIDEETIKEFCKV